MVIHINVKITNPIRINERSARQPRRLPRYHVASYPTLGPLAHPLAFPSRTPRQPPSKHFPPLNYPFTSQGAVLWAASKPAGTCPEAAVPHHPEGRIPHTATLRPAAGRSALVHTRAAAGPGSASRNLHGEHPTSGPAAAAAEARTYRAAPSTRCRTWAAYHGGGRGASGNRRGRVGRR